MSQICSKMANFLFSAYFGGHFCYHSNGKSQINTRVLHFGYCSNKLSKNYLKAIFVFCLKGGGGGHNSLLMHVPLYTVTESENPNAMVIV